MASKRRETTFSFLLTKFQLNKVFSYKIYFIEIFLDYDKAIKIFVFCKTSFCFNQLMWHYYQLQTSLMNNFNYMSYKHILSVKNIYLC